MAKKYKTNYIELMKSEKITKTILIIAIPTILAFMVADVHNILSVYFINMFIGVKALSALSIVSNFSLFIVGISYLIARGTQINISQLLGKNDGDEISIFAFNSFFLAILVGIIFTIISLLNINFIINILGTTSNLHSLVKEYVEWTLVFSTFIILYFVFFGFLIAEGKTKIAFYMSTLFAIINVVFLPLILIFTRSIATVAFVNCLGDGAVFFVMFVYVVKGNSVVKFKKNKLVLKLNVILQILFYGLPSFVPFMIQIIALIFLVKFILIFGNYTNLAIWGAAFKVYFFVMLILIGLRHGLQPILSYNFGINNKKRTISTLNKGLLITIIISLISLLLMILFSHFFMNNLVTKNTKYKYIGLILLFIAIPFWSTSTILSGYFQAVSKIYRSIFIDSVTWIILVPLAYFLFVKFGIIGAYLVFPVEGIIIFIIFIIFYVIEIKTI